MLWLWPKSKFEVYKKQCIEYEKILTGHEPKILKKISLCVGEKGL